MHVKHHQSTKDFSVFMNRIIETAFLLIIFLGIGREGIVVLIE